MIKNEKNNPAESQNNSNSNSFPSSQSSAVVGNRLEALKVLSKSLMEEIEAIRQEGAETISDKIDLAQEVQRFEEDLIRCALVRTGGRQRRAAKILNVKVTTLNAKIKRYGIT